MAWIEKQHGRYERPFDSMERFHKAYGAIGHSFDREHFSLSAAVQFCFDPALGDIAEVLKQTWKTMRFRYPQIAAFAHGEIYVYEVPDAAALESWLACTFIVEPSTTTASALQATFKPQKLATLHYLPHSSEILFHTAHWRIDGVGTLQFFDSFFEALAHPEVVEFGSEYKNLTQALDEAAKVPKQITPQIEQVSTARLMEFLTNLPSIGLPILPEHTPGATHRLTAELDPQTTSALIAKCKAQSISVTAAIHAAVVCATQQMADPARPGTKYTTFTFFDLRKHLPPESLGRDFALTVYHVGLPATFHPSDFSSNAKELKKIYARPFSTPDENVFTFLPCYVDMVTRMVSQPAPPNSLPATEGNFSSLGLIDKYMKAKYDKIEITDFWLGVEMLTSIPMIHAWTFQGRTKFNLSYNESFFSQDSAQSFLDKVVAALLEGLGVQRQPHDQAQSTDV